MLILFLKLCSRITFSLFQSKSKISASRRLFLKTKLVKKAMAMLVAEKEQKAIDKEVTLNERLPPLMLSVSFLFTESCKELHQKMDVVDEERYDIAMKVSKSNTEIENLSMKIIELKGKKRPQLKRVRVSAEAMMGALLGAKVKESVDFKANLKTVKKEEEKKEEVTDWRKNVDAMSGMEGRKKMFAS
uniref:Troponin I4b, tandem duplicate 2 n=1 Tax=Esox lucius TaxID=8010 RepID=A0AAY5KRM9_ESOLU